MPCKNALSQLKPGVVLPPPHNPAWCLQGKMHLQRLWRGQAHGWTCFFAADGMRHMAPSKALPASLKLFQPPFSTSKPHLQDHWDFLAPAVLLAAAWMHNDMLVVQQAPQRTPSSKSCFLGFTCLEIVCSITLLTPVPKHFQKWAERGSYLEAWPGIRPLWNSTDPVAPLLPGPWEYLH